MFGMLFCTQVVGDTLLDENIGSDYHTTQVVLTLMGDLLHKGDCAYIDNSHTSIEICNVLRRLLSHAKNLYCFIKNPTLWCNWSQMGLTSH